MVPEAILHSPASQANIKALLKTHSSRQMVETLAASAPTCVKFVHSFGVLHKTTGAAVHLANIFFQNTWHLRVSVGAHAEVLKQVAVNPVQRTQVT